MEENVKSQSALPQTLRSPSAVGSEDSCNTQEDSLHPPFHKSLMSCVGRGQAPS